MATRASAGVYGGSHQFFGQKLHRLTEFAEHEFWLSEKIGKITRRQHLKAVQKQTGNPEKELQSEPLPQELQHVWHWFLELHGGRSVGLNGPQPISYGEIDSYNRLLHRNLHKWEVQAIKQVDQLWIKHHD